MTSPRVLTFNFHEPYICLMAKTGIPLTVGRYESGDLARRWQTRFRPVPPGLTMLREPDWRHDLGAGRFDVVIAHNETNAMDILYAAVSSNTPVLLVLHNRLTYLLTTIPEGDTKLRRAFDKYLELLREHVEFVFISESKRDDYGIPGRVIPPGIDVEDYGGYRGEEARVLRVGNMMRARNVMFDVDFQERVCAGLPNRVMGMDPGIPEARPSTSFEDLLETFRSHRCLLHVTREEFEDGYNLATLEAMACGMPVVSLANATSPLTDGVDGFVSPDAEVLRERLAALLEDRDLAAEIGARGRETVARSFPFSAFAEKWAQAIEEAAEDGAHRRRSATPRRLRGQSAYEAGGYFRGNRRDLLPHVPEGTRRLLDCGCAAGEFGRLAKDHGVAEVVGIDIDTRACEMAEDVLDRVICGNIEELEIPYQDGYFDCIVCADLLEHLVDPTATLVKLTRVLSSDGVIVMSIPNVRFYDVLAMLANGRWQYADAGIMDRTHLRFFTAFEMCEMVKEAGLAVERMQPLCMLSPATLPRDADGSLTFGRITIRGVDDRELQDLLTYQYLIVAKKDSAPDLQAAHEALEHGDDARAFDLAERAQGADPFERTRIMAKAVGRLGKLEASASLYEKAVALRPDAATVAAEYGIVLVAMNRIAEARILLERVLHVEPENDRALAAMGLVKLTEGAPAQAFDLFKASLEIHFDNETILGHLLELARTLGRLEEAEPIARRFVEFYPANTGMCVAYARLLGDLGRRTQALEQLDTVLTFFPDNEPAQILARELKEASREAGE